MPPNATSSKANCTGRSPAAHSLGRGQCLQFSSVPFNPLQSQGPWRPESAGTATEQY
ncbi:uncharacterized protein TrAtP1_002203 [Trichoderma atroviride]|uniref:uncharacterized protein n=1 Tax=Hypocrea atroviridis TaxID=63577 RepID=UPI003320EFE4|nr:hypothetical protein TrAtP1_002203 [Trichoderma atroviride]